MTVPERHDEEGDAPLGKAPRPDEMTREVFEFVAAIDQFKRTHGRPHLVPEEVLRVLGGLGYARPKKRRDATAEYERALRAYRERHGRLFPNWSEIFGVLLELGYVRARRDEAA